MLEIGSPGDDNFVRLIESDVIARFVATHWRDQGAQLIPNDSLREASVNLFVGQFMSQLAPTIFSIMATKEASAADKIFTKLVRGIQTIDRTLKIHGEQADDTGPFLLGNQYTLAETLTAPFVVRMIPIFKHHRGVDVLGLCDRMGASSLRRWMEAVCERPSTQQSLPAEKSLLAVPPYVQPFFEYYIPASTQEAVVSASLDTTAAARAQEKAFQQTLKEGSQIAGYKEGTLSKKSRPKSRL